MAGPRSNSPGSSLLYRGLSPSNTEEGRIGHDSTNDGSWSSALRFAPRKRPAAKASTQRTPASLLKHPPAPQAPAVVSEIVMQLSADELEQDKRLAQAAAEEREAAQDGVRKMILISGRLGHP